MILFRWHSLLLIPTTPTCNGVYQVWYGFVVFSIIRRGADDEESWCFSRRGGKSCKPSYLMTWVLLHSLLWIPITPTSDGLYQIWYSVVVISITRSGGMDDKSWVSQQNSHYYLVAGRFDPFFCAKILHYTRPPPHTLCGVFVWSKMMNKCSF